MRVLGWVLAGALALTAPIGVQAGSLGPGWYPMPNGWDGDWRRATSPPRQSNGGPVSPRWCANRPPGGRACCAGAGVFHLLGLGSQRRFFDYPFADWRGPTGRWGNPEPTGAQSLRLGFHSAQRDLIPRCETLWAAAAFGRFELRRKAYLPQVSPRAISRWAFH